MSATSAREAAPHPSFDGYGREGELARAHAALADLSVRLVTFTGPAGVGKTWAASRLASRMGRTDRVVTVPLRRVRDHAGLLESLAGVAGLSPGRGTLGDRLVAALEREPTLVVLDECEWLAGSPHPVTELVDAVPGLRVVATSLRPLGIAGEQVVGLDPLPVPRPAGSAQELRANPSVRLFCARAAAARAGFEPEDDDLDAIGELCRRVHGLPLGIELLAASLPGLRPVDLLGQLDSGHPVSVRYAVRRDDSHHLSLADAMRWSYAMLPPDAQALLRRMTAFAGPADLDLLTAVAGRSAADVVDALSDLVDHRLVEAYDGPGEPAFTVVPLLRDFAADRLVDDGEHESAEAAHTRAMTAFVLARSEAVESALDDASLSELARSEADIRRALRRLMGEADVSEGLRLATALAPYVLCRSYDGYVGAALDALLRRAESLHVDDGVRAGALLWRVRLAVHFDGPETVTDLRGDLDGAVALARRSGDPQTLLLGLAHVMLALPVTGDFAGAGAAAAEGLPLAETSGDDRWAARFCAWAGMVANQSGDADRAEELARRGVDHVRAVPDHRAEVLLAMLVAGLPDGRGATLMAQLPDLDTLIESARRLDDSRYVPFLLRNAAVAAVRGGDLPTAAARCAEGLRLSAWQGAWHGLPFTVMVLGLVAVARNDLADAARCHGMVRDRLEQLRPAAPGEWFDGYVATMDDVRRRLGEAAFEAAARGGADAMTGSPLPGLLDYADRVAGTAERGRRNGRRRERSDNVLTPREEDVLRALATGVTNNEIGRLLGMSPKTVMHHSVSIYRKLGVRGRAEATAWALRQGFAR